MSSGFWGRITATRDWCEPNYAVTWYVAEFYNTISNLAFIVAFLNILHYQRKYRQYLTFNYSLLMYGILIVGVCSALFHGTLWFWPQQMDRIFCLYPFVGAAQSLLDYHRAVASAWLTLVHCAFSFIWMFVLFEVYLALIAVYAMYKSYSISTEYIHSKALTAQVWRSAVVLVVSFAINGLDLFLCDTFVRVLSFVPHLHAIWHVGSAVGLHTLGLVVMYINLHKHNLEPKFKIIRRLGICYGVHAIHTKLNTPIATPELENM